MRSLVALAWVLWVACGGDESDGEHGGHGKHGDHAKKPAVTVVEVAPAEKGAIGEALLANAVVESESAADLYPAASGLVVSIHKDEGDPVRQGALLAVLENVTLEANSERADVELAQLEAEYARSVELLAVGAISQKELDDVDARLRTARTTAREAQHTEGQTRIVAPFDGVVALRDVRVGEYVSSGSRAFQVVDPNRLRVVASLPERDLSRVAVGQTARLVSAYDPDLWSHATVSRIAPVVDATSGTFRVTLAVDGTRSRLRPGQFVSVALEVDRHTDVLVIPRQAVLYEEGRAVVYTMVPAPPEEKKEEEEPAEAKGWWPFAEAAEEEEDTDRPDDGPYFVASRKSVEKGIVSGETVEILSGISAGDQVIVLGHSNLRDGARVRTADVAAQPSAPPEPAGDEG